MQDKANVADYSILLVSAKNAEGMKEHRQAVKCEARSPFQFIRRTFGTLFTS